MGLQSKNNITFVQTHRGYLVVDGEEFASLSGYVRLIGTKDGKFGKEFFVLISDSKTGDDETTYSLGFLFESITGSGLSNILLNCELGKKYTFKPYEFLDNEDDSKIVRGMSVTNEKGVKVSKKYTKENPHPDSVEPYEYKANCLLLELSISEKFPKIESAKKLEDAQKLEEALKKESEK